MDEMYINVCKKLGWGVSVLEDDGIVELSKESPAGEDFFFSVDIDGFVENVTEYVVSFDQDEHVELWIGARHSGTSGVPSTRELVKDATAIAKMLQELETALWDAGLEGDGDEPEPELELGVDDDLLEGMTFYDLITAVRCNCRDITPEAVRCELDSLLTSRLQDMETLLEKNMNAIIEAVRR